MRPLVFILLALVTLSSAAQTPVSNFLLEETTLHSGTAAQFESAQKDYCAAVVRGGAPACLVFSTATFGQSDRYFTMLPFASFIHYDQGKYTEKGLTPDQARALSARRAPPIASNHESALALHPELSILAPNDTPLNYVTEYRIRPGSLDNFLSAIRKYMLPGVRKSGVESFEVFTTTVGGDSNRVLIVARLQKFADLDQPDPILASMGRIRRSSFETGTQSTIQHVETYIMRYRADLSTDPRPTPPSSK